MGGDLVRDLVEVDPLDDPGEAERVVAVEVRDADPVQVVRGDPGAQHLALGALAGVEEDALAVPAQQVAVVVAVPGRDLARGAEDDQFPYGQAAALPGGPLHAAAAEDVGVRVQDGLAGAAAGVEDDAVAVSSFSSSATARPRAARRRRVAVRRRRGRRRRGGGPSG